MDYSLEKIISLSNMLEALSLGIDPTSGMDFSNDTILKNARLRSCFAQTAELLEIVSENLDWVSRRQKGNTKHVFHLFQEEMDQIPITDGMISVSEFTYSINSIVKTEKMRKLKATQITQWLTKRGYLEELSNENGTGYKVVTVLGKKLGITSQKKVNSQNDIYSLNLYNKNARAFIIENINEIGLEQ